MEIQTVPGEAPKCEWAGCEKKPRLVCHFTWAHKCNEEECTVPVGSEEGLILPYRFCKDHAPSKETIMKSDKFNQARESVLQANGNDILKCELGFRMIDVYEENPSLN